MKVVFNLGVLLVAAVFPAIAVAETMPVGPGNFVRAESDRYIDDMVAAQGIGAFVHQRVPVPLDKQTVIRMNRDTLYSLGVYDLGVGDITITFPEAGNDRYRAVQVLSQDHLNVAVFHDGTHVISQTDAGTRFVVVLMRTFVDPADDADIAKAHAAQDAVTIGQDARGGWTWPDWDREDIDATRAALIALGGLPRDGLGVPMGARGAVDPVSHLIATAMGWGLNPPSEATYILDAVPENDGHTVFQLTMQDVPVDGFWSVSVYNAAGFFEPNATGINSINNVTGTAAADGSYVIQFGGCDNGVVNCIPTMEGWNYTLRLYRPQAALVDGSWTVPKPIALP